MCDTVNICEPADGGKRGKLFKDVMHDSILMLPFSCSHRPGVCITRPNCKARSDGEEGRGPF